MFSYSIHENFSDANLKKSQMHKDWTDLVLELGENLPIVPNKSNLRALVPVQWQPGVTTGKSLANVESVHFLVLDIDRDLTEESLIGLKHKLSTHRFFLYFTHSCHRYFHSLGLYKVRVVIPLSEPIPRVQWPRFWEKASRYFSEWTLDPQCRNANHLYYMPGVPSQEVHDWFKSGNDQWFDWDRGLEENLDVDLINDVELPNYTRNVGGGLVYNIPIALIEEQLIKKARQMVASERQHALGVALLALLRGQSYSDADTRHNTMISLANYIGTQYPKRTPGILASIFERSHAEMAAIHDTPPDTVAQVVEAVSSAQVKAEARAAERTSREDKHTIHYMKKAVGSIDPDYRYTEEDRAAIAQGLGIPLEDLDYYWVMLSPSAEEAYFLTKNGIRPTPVRAESVAADIPYLTPTGIPLRKNSGSDKNPRWTTKSLKDLIETNGTRLLAVRYDNRITSHRIERNGTILTFPCIHNPIRPAFNEDVNGYLECLFGDSFDKARDWLSIFPDTSQLLCALILTGPGGIGKSLLMDGLAKIWSHKPVKFADALQRFNFDMTQTPYIISDEGLPDNREVTRRLREFTGRYEFQCEKKFGAIYESVGARRIVIASNSKQALKFYLEDLEKNDLDAIQERIWVCDGQLTAKHYLQILAKQHTKEIFTAFAQHKIAQHVLWLNENHTFTPDPSQRFAVEGSKTITANIVLADAPSQEIFTMLMMVMQQQMDAKGNRAKPVGIKWGKGKVYMTGPGVRANWDVLDNKRAQWTQPGKHLAKVGHKTTYLDGKKTIAAFSVKTDLFYEFLDRDMGCDVAPFKEMIDA